MNRAFYLILSLLIVVCCYSGEKIDDSPLSIGGSREKLATEFPLLFDLKFTPYFGASAVESGYSLFTTIWPSAGISSFYIRDPYSPVRILERAGHAAVDFFVISELLTIINHEALGHGFRLREAEVGKAKISLFSAVPKDPTRLTYLKNKLSAAEFTQKEISVHIGGIETSDILAKTRTLNFLRRNRISPNDAFLFIKSMFDGIKYIQGASDSGRTLQNVIQLATVAQNSTNNPSTMQLLKIQMLNYDDSQFIRRDSNSFPTNVYTMWLDDYLDDIQNYVFKINELYGGKKALSVNKLQNLNFLNHFDPFIYYSGYYLAVEYIIKGNLQWKYPMIPLGKNIGYLPGFKLILTPYGPEKQFINYIRYYNNSYRFYFIYGKTLTKKSYGLGCDVNPIGINYHFAIGGKIYLWKQPELFTQKPINATEKFGVLLQVNTEYKIHKKISTLVNLGYKTKGFIQGAVLENSIIAELGLRLSI